MKRVLILEPYYGGSHKNFLLGLQKNIPAEYRLISLPARKWKIRMQLSAVWLVEQIKSLTVSERYFDTVLCSSFIDVAVLRATLIAVKGWNQDARVLTYFHENQFVYPELIDSTESHHFSSINFHSALASDEIAFNSEFNRDSFLDGCRRGLRASSEMKFPGLMEDLSNKIRVLYPGVDFLEIDKIKWKTQVDIPVIIWNHRWEHDKNPTVFFQALDQLERRGVDFRLIMLGQSFQKHPQCFKDARKKFNHKILHFGFLRSYRDYVGLLGQGDFVVSTALHEFYGISVIEAVRAGCVPILPDRLSYPELFDRQFLYDDAFFSEYLESVVGKRKRLKRKEAISMTEKFSWPLLQSDYLQWL